MRGPINSFINGFINYSLNSILAEIAFILQPISLQALFFVELYKYYTNHTNEYLNLCYYIY